MRLDIAAQSDTGRRKKNNEDYFGVYRDDTPDLTFFKEGALLCVADGLGGHTSGEIASKLTVSILKDLLKEAPHPQPEDPESSAGDQGPFESLRNAIKRANDSIYQTNQDLVRKGKPMGTTITAALVEPRRVYVANVGDSRCYLLRDGEFIERTEDHSWVDDQVRQGLMSKAEAETDARRNVVTRCIGTAAEVVVDTYRWNIIPGDILFLCTDGLSNMVPDADILAEFHKGGTPAEIATRLVSLANENGGKDNITAVIAVISPNPLRQFYRRVRAFFRRKHLTWPYLLFLLVYGLTCLAAGYALAHNFPIR